VTGCEAGELGSHIANAVLAQGWNVHSSADVAIPPRGLLDLVSGIRRLKSIPGSIEVILSRLENKSRESRGLRISWSDADVERALMRFVDA
jgi:hypothetical protein